MRYGALRITLIYVFVSLLWITFSDQLLFFFERNLQPAHMLWISTAKGYFFVLLNGGFLFWLMRSDERQLAQSEQQYRLMYEANPNPMWIYAMDTLQIISVNDAAIAAYGYTQVEFLTKTILDIRPAEDAQKVLDSVKEVRNNFNQSGTWRHLKKSGQIIYVNINSHQVKFNDGPNMLVMARDVTERVVFEQALETVNQDLLRERQKLKETQLMSKIGGWEYYPETRDLIWADEIYEITGVARDDSRSAFDIYIHHIYPDDRELMINALDALINHGQPLDVTHRIIALDGGTRYIRQLARLDQLGANPSKIIGSLQDVTALKQLEKERNHYQHHFERALNSISDAFFALDKNMVVTRLNDVFCTLIGKKADQIIGQAVFDLFPRELNRFYAVYQKALENRVIVRQEDYSVILQKWIRLIAYPTDDGVAVYFSDISEDKKKDRQLKEAVERYELVAQATSDVIYDLDIVHDQLVYNTSLTQLVHFPVDEIAYNLAWWRKLIHPDDVEEVVSSQEKVAREGKTNWVCEYRIDAGNGAYKYIMDQGYFVFNEQMQAIRLIGVIKDIDELKRTGQENKRLANIITRVNNMIILTDTSRHVIWVNKAFEEITGFTLEAVKGRVPADFMRGPEFDETVVPEIIRQQQQRATFAMDMLIYTAAGFPIWVAVEWTPAFDEKNNYQGYIAVCQNITSRKQKEQEIQHQNELLKEVAWMSSHEIRRPVASLLGLIDLLNSAENEQERAEILPMLTRCVHDMDETVHAINDKIQTT